jgi:phospholipid/cholesterol/gamma-HCH transport system substrate-binding protein
MRRLAVIGFALVATVAWWVTASAGADDSHTYKIDMYNAFGIVNGSDVRIGGVNSGSVTGLDINSKKQAVATVSLTGPLSVLGKDSRCASQPQSLIAEYFIDCTPKGPPLPDGGTIPANQVRMTVQNDLVANSLRTSFRDRLAMIIDEFGTGLAGNAQSLNEAIRLGSPALFNLRKVLDILANQAATIRDLNVNSDRIITQLANNRANLIRFIQTAGRTSAISASRRADLSVDFNRLDNFLHQLGPTLAQLGATSRESTPLLRDLRAAAPGLNTLATNLPAFNRASAASLGALARASVPGRKAVVQGRDEVQALKRAGQNAQPVADTLAKFLADIAAPSRATNIDARAADTCPKGTKKPKTKPCYSTGRKAPTGYSGMESLLNYVYYQATSLNQFDQIGHLLHFSLYDVQTGPCGNFSSGHDATTGKPGVGSTSGGLTTNITKTAPCVSWLGPNQPGINQNLHLPPWSKSVCPNGTTPAAALKYCNPGGPKQKGSGTATVPATAKVSGASASRGGGPGSGGATGQVTPGGQGPVPGLPPGVAPQGQDALHRLEQILGLPQGGGLGNALGHGGVGGTGVGGANNGLGGVLGGQPKSGNKHRRSSGAASQGTAGATQSLLNYLLGNG